MEPRAHPRLGGLLDLADALLAHAPRRAELLQRGGLVGEEALPDDVLLAGGEGGEGVLDDDAEAAALFVVGEGFSSAEAAPLARRSWMGRLLPLRLLAQADVAGDEQREQLGHALGGRGRSWPRAPPAAARGSGG